MRPKTTYERKKQAPRAWRRKRQSYPDGTAGPVTVIRNGVRRTESALTSSELSKMTRGSRSHGAAKIVLLPKR